MLPPFSFPRQLMRTCAWTVVLGLSVGQHASASEAVTLSSNDGQFVFEGDLISLEQGKYRILSTLGELHVREDLVTCEGPGCPKAEPDNVYVFGEPVVLQTLDRTVKLSGILRDIIDGNYVLETPGLGVIRIALNDSTCTGAGCPDERPLAVAQVAPPPVQQDTTETIEGALAAAVQLSIGANTQDVSAAVEPVRFVGSTSLGGDLIPALLTGFGSHLGVRTSLDATGTSLLDARYPAGDENEQSSIEFRPFQDDNAFEQIATGTADFLITTRRKTDAQAQRMIALGLGDLRGTQNEVPIAYDVTTIMVNASNPVQALSAEDIARIYAGQVTDWSQLGAGGSGTISVLAPSTGSSRYASFETSILQDDISGETARGLRTLASDAAMIEAIQNDPNAIGIAGAVAASGVKSVDLIRSCGITSAASPFSVKSEEYTLGQRLYLYTRPGELAETSQKFISYVMSGAADSAFRETGYVDFSIERQSQTAERKRRLFDGLESTAENNLANELREQLEEFDRLSTTIRFDSGSFDLGLKETNDISRMASYLAALPFAANVELVGFADSEGRFSGNARLSAQRAETVAEAFRSAGLANAPDVEIVTRGYGELAPIACNSEAQGRSINRRVEIWIERNVN